MYFRVEPMLCSLVSLFSSAKDGLEPPPPAFSGLRSTAVIRTAKAR